MEYKALTSFAGVVSGFPGEVLTIENKVIAKDLLKAGYIEPAKAKTGAITKGGGKNED